MILELLLIGLIVLCVFVAAVSYYSNLPVLVKLVVLPFAITFSTYVWYYVYDNMGTPVEGMPQGEFTYIYHMPTSGGKDIILWSEQDDDHRLYIFKYDRENMKKLEDAREQQEAESPEGVEMEISNGMFRILDDDEIITDEIGSDARIKKQSQTAQSHRSTF